MHSVPIEPGTIAYSYIRMSTDQQLKGDSLRRQLDLSREWADRNGLLLDESLRDIGVSAFKGKNRRDGALGKFLSMVEMGRIPRGACLLVESLDRLSRDQVLEALSLFLEILRSGITIVTLSDGQTYSQETVGNDWSKLIISLTIMARAHEESARKSERIAQSYMARRAKASQGNFNLSCRVPFWMDAQRVDRDHITYSLNQHAATIRRAYELAADGMTRIGIAKIFNTEGVPTLSGKDSGWAQGTINRILDSRESLGEYQPQQMIAGTRKPIGEPILGYFPAVVDEALWARARAFKRKRASSVGRKGKRFTNLFVHMARCVHCGGPMTLHRSTQATSRTGDAADKSSRSYISCGRRRRGMGCTGPARGFRYDRVEDTILDHVHEFMLHDVMRIKQANSPIGAIEQEIKTKRAQLDEIKRKEQNLIAQLEASDILLPSVVERIKSRQKESEALTSDLEQLALKRNAAQHEVVEVASEQDIKEMRALWQRADEQEALVLRTKAHVALRSFIDMINFDAKEATYTVVILGNLRVYKFSDGEMLSKIDLLGQLGDRASGKIDPSVFLTDGITAEIDPKRAETLDKLRSSTS